MEVQEDGFVEVQDEQLKRFMKYFRLEDSDLSVDWLPAFTVTYKGSVPAAICAEEAKQLLRDTVKAYQVSEDREGYLQKKKALGLYSEAEGEFKLRVLKMEDMSHMSPVAIVCKRRCEMREAVVFHGDQFAFLYSPSLLRDQQTSENPVKQLKERTSRRFDERSLSLLSVEHVSKDEEL